MWIYYVGLDSDIQGLSFRLIQSVTKSVSLILFVNSWIFRFLFALLVAYWVALEEYNSLLWQIQLDLVQL